MGRGRSSEEGHSSTHTLWPRSAGVSGTAKDGRVGAACLDSCLCPSRALQPGHMPAAQQQAQQVPGVWRRPVVEPAYIGWASSSEAARSTGTPCSQHRSLDREYGHERSAVLRPACPGQLRHTLHLLLAPASPATYTLDSSLLSAPGCPPGRVWRAAREHHGGHSEVSAPALATLPCKVMPVVHCRHPGVPFTSQP